MNLSEESRELFEKMLDGSSGMWNEKYLEAAKSALACDDANKGYTVDEADKIRELLLKWLGKPDPRLCVESVVKSLAPHFRVEKVVTREEAKEAILNKLQEAMPGWFMRENALEAILDAIMALQLERPDDSERVKELEKKAKLLLDVKETLDKVDEDLLPWMMEHEGVSTKQAVPMILKELAEARKQRPPLDKKAAIECCKQYWMSRNWGWSDGCTCLAETINNLCDHFSAPDKPDKLDQIVDQLGRLPRNQSDYLPTITINNLQWIAGYPDAPDSLVAGKTWPDDPIAFLQDLIAKQTPTKEQVLKDIEYLMGVHLVGGKPSEETERIRKFIEAQGEKQ